jgi:hypothetical protein
MIKRSREEYAGQDCIKIENGPLAVWASLSVGPRILALRLHGGENLFASLPDLTLDCPNYGVFHFYGGHRLWIAPEDPARTYLPDDAPVKLTEIEDGVCLTNPAGEISGIQKKISIHLEAGVARLTVEHSLTNHSEIRREMAAWGITQLKTGGIALLPLDGPVADPYGVTSNRNLVLWPYTDLSVPQLCLGKRLLRLHTQVKEGAFKIGFANFSGWLAYLLGEVLFIKKTSYQAGYTYPDRGSSSECYCNTDFLELESLSPAAILEPGETITHIEQWALFDNVSLPEDEIGVLETLKKYGLEIAG